MTAVPQVLYKQVMAYRRLQMHKADVEEQIKVLKEEIDEQLVENDMESADFTLETGQHVTIRPSRRFSPRLAEEALSPEELRLVTKEVLDAKKVKDFLGDGYEAVQESYGVTIKITD